MGRRSHSSLGWHEGYAKAVTRQVIARAGGRCEVGLPGICTIEATQADHITPVSQGGAVRDLANLRASCRPCNEHLGGKLGGISAATKARQRAARLAELEAQFGALMPRQAGQTTTIDRPPKESCTSADKVRYGWWSREW